MTLADQAADFLAARTWDARTRQWVPRPVDAPVAFITPVTTTPAVLFAAAYRDEEAQAWGDIAPPRRPVPEARRNVMGAIWKGEAWAQSTEGERWPSPASTAWLRLRCTPQTKRGKPPTRAHKAFHWTGEGWTKEGEVPGWRFTPEEVAIGDDVDDWADFLEAASDDRHAFIVRGVMARNPDRRGRVRRAKRDDNGAWIGEHPIGRRVMLLDVDDKLPVAEVWPEWPGFHRVPTEDEIATLVRRTLRWALPVAFHDAACAVQLSASCGIPGGTRGPSGWGELRAHIVIVVTRPFCDASFRDWINQHAPKVEAVNKAGKVEVKPVIDPAPADPIQFMYVAAPTFTGAPSPWPAHLPRVLRLPGVREVEAPEELLDGPAWREQHAADDALRELSAALEEVAAGEEALTRARERETAARVRLHAASLPTGGNLDTLGARVAAAEEQRAAKRIAGWCADVLANACQIIRDDPHHDGLRRAALRAYWAVSPGLLDESEARTAIADAWCALGTRDGESAADRANEAARVLNFAARKSAADRMTLDKVRDYLAARDDIEEGAR